MREVESLAPEKKTDVVVVVSGFAVDVQQVLIWAPRAPANCPLAFALPEADQERSACILGYSQDRLAFEVVDELAAVNHRPFSGVIGTSDAAGILGAADRILTASAAATMEAPHVQTPRLVFVLRTASVKANV